MSTFFENQEPAQHYAAARALPPETLRMWPGLVKAVIDPFKPTRILDLGAGTGRFTACLQAAFAVPVVAVEPSGEMRAAGPPGPSVEWREGSAEAIPLDDRSVDLVWMSQVFHHIEDHAQAMRQIRRVLRPGGYFVLRNGTLENNEDTPWLKCFPEAMEFDRHRLFSQNDLIREVGGSGFACVWWATINQITAPSYAEYSPRIARRALSSLIAISDDEFRRGLAALARWIEDMDSDGPVFEPVDLFVFREAV
jgi:ubiquinone/menaquinone biosynthesis C-methylase UbiE